MKKALAAFLGAVRSHKGKILLVPALVVGWALLIFPTGDLADLVSTKVSQATGDKVSLDMDSVGVSLFPLGAKLTNVSIEAQGAPTVKVDSLTVSPSVSSILAFKPGGSASVRGFFGGDADVTFSQGAATKGGRVQEIDASLEGVSLKKVYELVKASMMYDLALEGRVSKARVAASFDPSLERQPTGSFDVALEKVKANLNDLLGIETAFSSVALVGRLSEGKLKVERADVGGAKDDLSATVKGVVDMDVVGGPGAYRFNPGAYELNVVLNVSETVAGRLGLVTMYLNNMRVQPEKTGNLTTYRFKVIGAGSTPRIEPAL